MTTDALGTTGGVVSGVEHRLAIGATIAVQGPTALDARTGVLSGPGSTAILTGTAATGTMTVAVGVFHAVTARNNAGGLYLGPNQEAATTVNIAAAPGSNSRIDVVYVKQSDSDATVLTPDGSTVPTLAVVTGTAAASPTKPAIPVGALELGTVTVAAGATSTNGAGVTISNTARQTAARGALVYVRNATEEAALTAYDGLLIYRADFGQIKVFINGIAQIAYNSLRPAPFIQSGRVVTNIVSANNTTGIVTFPTAFAAGPVVLLTVESNTTGVDLLADINVATPTTTQFQYRLRERGGTVGTYNAALHWMAIGT